MLTVVMPTLNVIRDVRFVAETDAGYQAHCRRCWNARRAAQVVTDPCPSSAFGTPGFGELAVVEVAASAPDTCEASEALPLPARRPSRSRIGRMVERAARRVLGHSVKLEPGRVVAWRERNRDGIYDTRYQEMDALWRSERDTVVLYEVKFTSLERMRLQVGRRQLERAARAALAHPQINAARTRLVYVGDAEDRLLADTGGLCEEDADSGFGVIWLSPERIEWAARDLGMDLPADWRGVRLSCAEPTYAAAA